MTNPTNLEIRKVLRQYARERNKDIKFDKNRSKRLNRWVDQFLAIPSGEYGKDWTIEYKGK